MKLKYVDQGDDGTYWRVGERQITDITMLENGNGPMGHYDMIYLYRNNAEKPFAAMPAHQCSIWEFEDD